MQARTWQVGLLLGAMGCGGGSIESATSDGAARVPGLNTGAAPQGAAASMSAASGAPGASRPATPGVGGAAAAGPAPVPMLPPEVEVKLDFEQPQASQRFVYALNPNAGTVSIIDAETQAIQTLETGDHPSFLRTLAGSDDAIVLNTGSSDATIIRNPQKRAVTSSVPVVKGANAIAVAPDGKHAVVYFNAEYRSASSSASLQDVSVLGLAPGADRAVGMTVGFRPRDVRFAADGSRAYVVTDDGVSVLDFAAVERDGTGIARLVTLGPGVDHKTMDVSVTADGRYAMARQPGASSVRLADLDSGELRIVDLAAVLPADVSALVDVDAGTPPAPAALDVSDLDLAPSGEFALAVVRDRSAVVRIPVPEGFLTPSTITTQLVPDEVIGSVVIAPDSAAALLYTTVANIERITYLRLDGSAPRPLLLRKTVEAVTIAPDGKTALVIHGKAEGDPNQRGIDPDVKIDRSFGYSALRLEGGDVKLQITLSMPGNFTMVPDGSAIFLLLRDDALMLRELQKIETKSFLVQAIALGSPPVSLGAVPGSKRVFVNQEHAEGRITFVDWNSNDTRTVTGFELNSRIRD